MFMTANLDNKLPVTKFYKNILLTLYKVFHIKKQTADYQQLCFSIVRQSFPNRKLRPHNGLLDFNKQRG